jgi:hypothetical protein
MHKIVIDVAEEYMERHHDLWLYYNATCTINTNIFM